MKSRRRIEAGLAAALALGDGPGRPPRLRAALRDAVFPAGGRLRPQLCLAVADACGGFEPALVEACAVAVELCHSASLVHDDLPCFDDALFRRGRPAIHRAHGPAMAVLVGDGLIALAFEVIARAPTLHPERLGALMAELAAAIGAGRGLVAGQAWEVEPGGTSLSRYHRAKTGALFEAAAALGAIAVGADPSHWRRAAAAIGEAYQVADDLADELASSRELGKPVGQDEALGRPNAAQTLGVDGAYDRINSLRLEAEAALPECPGRAHLVAWIAAVVERLLPALEAKAESVA